MVAWVIGGIIGLLTFESVLGEIATGLEPDKGFVFVTIVKLLIMLVLFIVGSVNKKYEG